MGLTYYLLVVVTQWTRQRGVSEIRNRVGTKLVFHKFLQCWKWFGVLWPASERGVVHASSWEEPTDSA